MLADLKARTRSPEELTAVVDALKLFMKERSESRYRPVKLVDVADVSFVAGDVDG